MTIDILPTVAALAGAELPKHPIDGKSIWALLSGESQVSPHEALHFYHANQLQAVRSGKWKLHAPHVYWALAGRPGGRDGKAAEYTEARLPLSLFDLEADPGETTNLADKYPEVVKRLEKLMDKIRDDLGDSKAAPGTREPGRIRAGVDEENQEAGGWRPAPSTLFWLLSLFVMNLCVCLAVPFFKNRRPARPIG